MGRLLYAVGLVLFCFAAQANRSELTYHDLTAPTNAVDFVSNQEFLQQETPMRALSFNGAIEVDSGEMRTIPLTIDERRFLPGDPQVFPGGRFEFVTHRGHLVPVYRDVIGYETSFFWKVILLPGRVWKERTDKGMSRAVFPFVLVNKFDGLSAIGIGTFLYNQSKVSHFRYQIVEQTSPAFIQVKDERGRWLDSQFTAVGKSKILSYQRYLPKSSARIKREYDQELASKWKVRDFMSLGKGMSGKRLIQFNHLADRFDYAGLAKFAVTSALVKNKTIYRKQCLTPHGPFPFCDSVLYGVQSISKSLVGSVLMLYFVEKYGRQILNRPIYELIPEIDSLSDPIAREVWRRATVRHVWNMASGVGEAPVDASKHDMYADGNYFDGFNALFFQAATIEEKLNYILATPPLKFIDGVVVGPGTRFSRYRDQEPVLLGIFLERYLQKENGPQASLWREYNEKILKPLGIWHVPVSRFFDATGNLALAAGYTSYFNIDAIAKLTHLIKSRGHHKEIGQLLNAGEMDEFLPGQQRTGSGEGWFIPSPIGVSDEVTNAKFFHLWPYRPNQNCFYQFPSMQGHGGNQVDIFPNGLIGIRITKNNDYYDDTSWWYENPMADFSNFLKPFCK